jgi:F420-dependent oxidoreductase-like protein
MRNYLEVLDAAFARPGTIDVENDQYRVHSPIDVTDLAVPVLIAALAPVMLRLAGERTAGTILWMADERAIGDHVVPRIAKAAAGAGRPAPRIVAGVPVVLCAKDEVDGAREWANQVLGHSDYSPNYQRLLEHGDASDVGDILAAGDESQIVERLRRFRDAGVTDLGVRCVPLGRDRAARVESRRRTEAFLSTLCPEL